MAFDFAYGKTTLGELELHGVHSEQTGQFHLTGVTIEGQLAIPSRGFVKSLCKRFEISSHLQQSRSSGELLGLIIRSFPLAEVDYRIEWDETGTTWLFAHSNDSATAVAELDTEVDRVPSSEERLAAYGFHSASDDEKSDMLPESQNWPLLRDDGCHVPAFPTLPSELPSQREGLFMTSPIGTPRSSLN